MYFHRHFKTERKKIIIQREHEMAAVISRERLRGKKIETIFKIKDM